VYVCVCCIHYLRMTDVALSVVYKLNGNEGDIVCVFKCVCVCLCTCVYVCLCVPRCVCCVCLLNCVCVYACGVYVCKGYVVRK